MLNKSLISMKRALILLMALVVCSCVSRRQELLSIFNDTSELSVDSLNWGVVSACRVWREKPWAKDYSEDEFVNYVLSPRVAEEPIEYYWRTDIPEWLGIRYEGESLLEFARKINSRIEVETRPEAWGNAQMGYTATMSGRFGKCDDRAILTVMAMRSMGIPAAFDIIPIWGSVSNGHSFCSVITPDNTSYAFQTVNDDGINAYFTHKVPKIYRKLFYEDTTSVAYRFRNDEDIPDLFTDYHLSDVTHCHGIGCRDVSIKSESEVNNRLCYLSVWHINGWKPVACGLYNDKIMKFKDVGVGVDADGSNTLKGENVGSGILYLPTMFDDGIIPVAAPLIVTMDDVRILHPSEKTESIIIYRKYPKLDRISKFADKMIGGVIEVAEKPDFSDAIPVHCIVTRPLSRMQYINLDQHKTFRYIRYRKPRGVCSIAELGVRDLNGKEILGTEISCEELSDVPSVKNIIDNAPVTYVEIPDGINMWVGVDLGKSVQVSAVGFCPRNDDNDISPGDTYELFYWNGRWKSLGQKTARIHSLRYDNVPKNTLLWLRNKTKGKEERPFTYDDSTQIWW